MTSHEIRKKFGFSQRDLAVRFGIPLSTVRNWDARGCMPGYIVNMLLQIYAFEHKKRSE